VSSTPVQSVGLPPWLVRLSRAGETATAGSAPVESEFHCRVLGSRPSGAGRQFSMNSPPEAGPSIPETKES
jgi:hypothetical protein